MHQPREVSTQRGRERGEGRETQRESQRERRERERERERDRGREGVVRAKCQGLFPGWASRYEALSAIS